MFKMPAPFPYPTDNITGILSLMNHANNITDGFLGIGLLIIIAVLMIVLTKGYRTEVSFGFAAFITLILSILLRFMNMITDGVLYIVIVAFVAILVWLWKSKEDSPM